MSKNENKNIDVADDLVKIHSAITRALEVLLENSNNFKKKLPEKEILDGFTMYLDCFITFLEGHHEIEDDIAFPFFKDKLPDTPFAKLMREHKEMVEILEKLDQANKKIKSSKNVSDGITEVHQFLTELQRIWYPHINSEETHLCSDCVCSVVPSNEQLKLVKRFGEHSKQHSKPATLVLPFLLYNLKKEDRAVVANSLPWIVTRFLVPHAWKKRWQPMKPYLM